jgi:hypothetical protein
MARSRVRPTKPKVIASKRSLALQDINKARSGALAVVNVQTFDNKPFRVKSYEQKRNCDCRTDNCSNDKPSTDVFRIREICSRP